VKGWIVAALLAAGACGSSEPKVTLDAPDPGPDSPSYRNSLAMCWTDASCRRVLAIAHGGSWDLDKLPYDSSGALRAAYLGGLDGVKIDVRVTADNVPVISHSSPIEVFESTECAGMKIEEMTADQVTACTRFPSDTEHFQRLDDVLDYLRGRLVVQLCVKRAQDYARTVSEIHTLGAEDFAFIEVASADDMLSVVPGIPGESTVYYLVNVASTLSDVDRLLAAHDPRAFMYEIDPGVDIGTIVPDRLHPAGIRSFIYDDTSPASVALLEGHYNAGFDVVSSQTGPNVTQARIDVNTARGVTPP
jgi:hypothetical protein